MNTEGVYNWVNSLASYYRTAEIISFGKNVHVHSGYIGQRELYGALCIHLYSSDNYTASSQIIIW